MHFSINIVKYKNLSDICHTRPPPHLKMFFCSPTFPVGICQSGVYFPGLSKNICGPFAPSPNFFLSGPPALSTRDGPASWTRAGILNLLNSPGLFSDVQKLDIAKMCSQNSKSEIAAYIHNTVGPARN